MLRVLLIFTCAAGAMGRHFNRWGVAMHYRHAGRPGETAMLSKGFKVARTDVFWDSVEVGKQHYDFSNYDALVAELEAHGVQPMLILDSRGNPKFYSQLLPHDTHTRQEFVNFAIAMMSHFKDRNVIWELWNEPNIPNAVWPAWTGQQYGLLAVQLGKAMRHAGLQNELLVGPATSGMLKRAGKFLEDVFATGACNYLDAITVHPYFDIPENTLYGDDTWDGLRGLMNSHGCHSKALISSEWGWNTCKKPCTASWGKYGVSESQQAHFLARQWLINWLHSVSSIFYQFNTPGTDPHNFEDTFGVVKYQYHNESHPYTPKPAYNAAVTLQNLFGGCDKVKHSKCCGSENVVLEAHNSQGNVTYAMWKSSVPVSSTEAGTLGSEVHVPVSSGCYTVYDMLGSNHGQTCSDSNRRRDLQQVRRRYIKVSLGSSPVYLVHSANSSAFESSADSVLVV